MILDAIKNLQKEISIFLVATVIAILIIGSSGIYWQTIMEENQAAKLSLQQSKEKYHAALNQKKILEIFSRQYKQLEKNGVVGNEKRINWVDELEKITRDKKIPYVKYKIDKQISLKEPEIVALYPGIDVFQSVMTLNMILLHEGDLYMIMNGLQKKSKGLFDVSQCMLSRNSSGGENILQTKTNKKFSAECKLNWFTMKQHSINALSYINNESKNE